MKWIKFEFIIKSKMIYTKYTELFNHILYFTKMN